MSEDQDEKISPYLQRCHQLFEEADSVFEEFNLTPRQLLEQRDELVELLKAHSEIYTNKKGFEGKSKTEQVEIRMGLHLATAKALAKLEQGEGV